MSLGIEGFFSSTNGAFPSPQSPKGRLQTRELLRQIEREGRFQSPKGRLQTSKVLSKLMYVLIGFNPQRGGYKLMVQFWALLRYQSFNPQRGGYKQVGKLDFIISTLCNGVNVFISVHHIKTAHSSVNSSDKTLSNPSVYPAAARNQLKILPHLNETVSKLNPRIFALKIDGYDFWSK